jgi:hypothetical protein
MSRSELEIELAAEGDNRRRSTQSTEEHLITSSAPPHPTFSSRLGLYNCAGRRVNSHRQASWAPTRATRPPGPSAIFGRQPRTNSAPGQPCLDFAGCDFAVGPPWHRAWIARPTPRRANRTEARTWGSLIFNASVASAGNTNPHRPQLPWTASRSPSSASRSCECWRHAEASRSG